MPLTKTKKKKKSVRMRGRNMGTHGGGARKNRKKSGNRGGGGMSGSGKRGDHKKTLITKKFGHGYFGKKGFTSRRTQKDKRQRINLQDIISNPEKYGKKTNQGWELNLENHKILGKGNLEKIGGKLIIKAKEASKLAIEKVKAAGGEIILPKKQEKKKPEEKSLENTETVEEKKED